MQPFKLCVVGSGPAGFYVSSRIFRQLANARVDMLEANPVPFGLVRYGVAPDHPEVKNCTTSFEKIMDLPQFRFFGGVKVGSLISLETLRSLYHAVVVCTGMPRARRLGIPGASLANTFTSEEFVGWYNGHPSAAKLKPNLERSLRAVIIGHGNVALDVARILMRPPEELKSLDISKHAFDVLRYNALKEIHVVGRRGPLQISFTTKELREMIQLPNVAFKTDKELIMQRLRERADWIAEDRPRKRLFEVLQNAAVESHAQEATRTWHLDFCLRPSRMLGSEKVTAVEFDMETVDRPDDPGKAVAMSTGQKRVIPADIVISCIGYQPETTFGLPSQSGRIKNAAGRVVDTSGVYVAGWAGRGPQGVLASTLADANETADSIVNDATFLIEKTLQPGDIECEIKRTKAPYFRTGDWRKIDHAEQLFGRAAGKPREKFAAPEAFIEYSKCN